MEVPEDKASAVEAEALRRRLDRWLAWPMFFLSLVFLVLAAGVIHRLGSGFFTDVEAGLLAWAVYLIWPLFTVEELIRFLLRKGPLWRRALSFLLVCLAPPARMAGRSLEDPNRLWLPVWGWRTVDRQLRKDLERFFSVPMILIALMVLPFLAMEYLWVDTVRTSFALSLTLDIGNSIIWMAFVIEFTMQVSVATNRFRYCVTNWMDLAVVSLPLIDYLPILRLLRLTRVLELQQLGRLSRIYRLRGLLLKAWRAILILEMIQRLFGNKREKRLKRLRELVTAKEEELADLRKEIQDLEQQVMQPSASSDPSPMDQNRKELDSIPVSRDEPR